MARRADHTREELKAMALSQAAAVTAKQGWRSVTARGVARGIGYTVGTLYNVFDDLDDLIVQMNGRTLDALYDWLTAEPLDKDPAKALARLARRYMDFVRSQPGLWSAVIEFQPRGAAASPDWLHAKAQRLIALCESAIDGYFDPDDTISRRRSANVLWGALYGITSLAQTNSLPDEDDTDGLVNTLIQTYVAGLESDRWKRDSQAGGPAGR